MPRHAITVFRVLALPLLVPNMTPLAQPTPGDAASAFFGAITAGEWRRAARMVDPAALAEARETELGMLANWAAVRPDLQRLKGEGMQGIVYDGHVDMNLIEKHRDLVVDLYGVKTLGEVAALSAEDMYASALEESTQSTVTGGRADLGTTNYKIVGTIQETDSVAHVLYRATSPNYLYDDQWHVHVLRVVRRGNQWLVRPSRELVMFSGASLLLMRMHLEETPPE